MAYSKMHRFFLRTVASQGVLSVVDAQAVKEKFNDEEELLSVTDLVKAINDEIRPYYQEIKITKDEVSNEDVVVFLSLADDAATKAQNIFSSTELEYFRVLMEHIMSTESRQITGINAMNLVSSMKSNFTKTDAQKVLNTWCRMRYFDKVEDNYALGVRAIHEFEGYFVQNMPHAVEECFLCKHIVFRGYNCPGCAQAVHTKCLLRFLERVQRWPCCKIDFEQEQLERLNTEGARLPPTQPLDTTRQSEENDTVAEPTQVQEASELMDETQEVIPEISQRVTRKRKRQIHTQVATETTTRTTRPVAETSTVAAPTEVLTTRSLKNCTLAEPARILTTRRSTNDDIFEEPTQLPTSRRSKRTSTIAEPAQVLTTHRSTKNNTIEEPTHVPSTSSTRNDTVAKPIRVPTTNPSTKDKIIKEPVQVLTTRRSIRNSTVAEPAQVLTTRRSTKDNIVEEPTQVSTTNHSKSNNTVAKPTQVKITRRSTRNNTGTEPVAEVQESFENLDVNDEVVPITQRVTRKRKQQM